jgi:hypothetical protein
MNAAAAARVRGAADAVALTIYSPAPPGNMLHELNLNLGRALDRWADGLGATVVPVPLPESINAIGALPDSGKRHRLPIVTTVDLRPAIAKAGPDWHAFSRANADLKFVTSLYDVAFGICAFDAAIASPHALRDRRIGAPPRPSSVRVLTEALLRDGWGILDDVEIVDLPPGEVAAAVAAGRIHATSWNFLHRAADGFVPLLANLVRTGAAHWLDVAPDAAAAMGRANPFDCETVAVPAGAVSGAAGGATPARTTTLLSFKQALAAWVCTEDDVVARILRCLAERGSEYAGLPRGVGAMAAWPALKRTVTHPAALRFFEAHGVAPGA